jgi:hypothetical protein
MVKATIAAQIAAGNAEQPLIKFFAANETRIILIMWGLIVAGLAIAVPAAINDGLFDQAPGVVGKAV